jgi:hypothetical protein
MQYIFIAIMDVTEFNQLCRYVAAAIFYDPNMDRTGAPVGKVAPNGGMLRLGISGKIEVEGKRDISKIALELADQVSVEDMTDYRKRR